jgi:hypothetical protein
VQFGSLIVILLALLVLPSRHGDDRCFYLGLGAYLFAKVRSWGLRSRAGRERAHHHASDGGRRPVVHRRDVGSSRSQVRSAAHLHGDPTDESDGEDNGDHPEPHSGLEDIANQLAAGEQYRGEHWYGKP